MLTINKLVMPIIIILSLNLKAYSLKLKEVRLQNLNNLKWEIDHLENHFHLPFMGIIMIKLFNKIIMILIDQQAYQK
jgi:hypothetical protein